MAGKLNSVIRLHAAVRELEQTNATLRGALDRQTEDTQSLKHDLAKAVAKSQEYQDKNEQLTEKVAALNSRNADLDKEVAVLSHSQEIAKTDLKAAQEKIAILADENKILLQEKAVILGQFKQLQESL